ncbi:hypothetical protein [Dickeya dianthicola]|uniref:hypothetical protein n=1 Tax=Dickeya dianthicola TaxID=204039 RepID=UPI001868EC95|nr:hypothetical protein [Dickeya dianthicola]QOL14513.1 hypothetical protein HGI48_10055 [Dickeya dianthicola]
MTAYVIKNILSQQLCHQFDSDGELVVVNNLVELNGGYPLKNQNKMVLTLINLEHETIKPFYGGRSASRPENTRIRQIMPPSGAWGITNWWVKPVARITR